MLKYTPMHKSFTKRWEKKINELNMVAHLFVHKKTGAEVLYLKNDEENKLFNIVFKTLPYDSTGIAHILEHVVLSGSKKYPLKEAFIEIVKNSLYTFLNAITFNDKTMYPVASQNNKDFKNLMDVYLDSVFNPLLSKNSFKQEGWRYKLENKGDDLTYEGVVFNEMKGAMANQNIIIDQSVIRNLYPDNTYKNNSGGEPSNITDLTYENFLKFYKENYHPSNAKVIFHGNVNIKKTLSHLENYFSKFEKRKINNKIKSQKPFTKPKIVEEEFIAKDKKGISAVGWGLLDIKDDKDYLGLEILDYILHDTDSSLYRKILLDSELGESIISAGFDTELKDPTFYTGLKGINTKDFEKIEKLVLHALKKTAKNLNKDIIEGAINSIEFSHRSRTHNITFTRIVLDNWLYNKNPLKGLKFEKPLNEIKKIKDKEKYFSDLINKYLLKNKHRVDVRLKPSSTLATKKQEEELSKLKNYKQSLTKQEIKKLVEDTKNFQKWQNTPDSKKDIAKLPQLKINEINKKSRKIKHKVLQNKNSTIIQVPQNTNKITYGTIYFDIKDLPYNLLPYLSLYSYVALRLGTKNLSYEQLANLIDIKTGGITTSIYNEVNSFTKEHLFKFGFRVRALDNNFKDGIDIIRQVLQEPNFDQPQRIKQLILTKNSILKNRIVSSGHTFARINALSKIDYAYNVQNSISGIAYFKNTQKIAKIMEGKTKKQEEKLAEIINAFKQINKVVYDNKNIDVVITAEKSNLKNAKGTIDQFISEIPEAKELSVGALISEKTKQKATVANKVKDFTPTYETESFDIPAEINYVTQSFKLDEVGYKRSGTLSAIHKMLTRDYLWNTVRAKGGAYGCFANIDTDSNVMSFGSYRDPNIKRTLNAYNKAGSYLVAKKFTKKELEGSIISSIGGMDTYLTPAAKGNIVLNRYLRGWTDEKIQKERDELLATTTKDFRDFGKKLNKVKNKSVTVVGNKEKIKQEKI